MASIQHQMQAARETDAGSGAVGDLHAAAARAELRRVADALGKRAVRALGEGTPRARAERDRRPHRAASRAGTAGITRGRRADG